MPSSYYAKLCVVFSVFCLVIPENAADKVPAETLFTPEFRMEAAKTEAERLLQQFDVHEIHDPAESEPKQQPHHHQYQQNQQPSEKTGGHPSDSKTSIAVGDPVFRAKHIKSKDDPTSLAPPVGGRAEKASVQMPSNSHVWANGKVMNVNNVVSSPQDLQLPADSTANLSAGFTAAATMNGALNDSSNDSKNVVTASVEETLLAESTGRVDTQSIAMDPQQSGSSEETTAMGETGKVGSADPVDSANQSQSVQLASPPHHDESESAVQHEDDVQSEIPASNTVDRANPPLESLAAESMPDGLTDPIPSESASEMVVHDGNRIQEDVPLSEQSAAGPVGINGESVLQRMADNRSAKLFWDMSNQAPLVEIEPIRTTRLDEVVVDPLKVNSDTCSNYGRYPPESSRVAESICSLTEESELQSTDVDSTSNAEQEILCSADGDLLQDQAFISSQCAKLANDSTEKGAVANIQPSEPTTVEKLSDFWWRNFTVFETTCARFYLHYYKPHAKQWSSFYLANQQQFEFVQRNAIGALTILPMATFFFGLYKLAAFGPQFFRTLFDSLHPHTQVRLKIVAVVIGVLLLIAFQTHWVFWCSLPVATLFYRWSGHRF